MYQHLVEFFFRFPRGVVNIFPGEAAGVVHVIDGADDFAVELESQLVGPVFRVAVGERFAGHHGKICLVEVVHVAAVCGNQLAVDGPAAGPP